MKQEMIKPYKYHQSTALVKIFSNLAFSSEDLFRPASYGSLKSTIGVGKREVIRYRINPFIRPPLLLTSETSNSTK